MTDPIAVLRAFHFEMVGTAVFAITGVLVVTRRGLDVFGALVLGMVTALGGGTLRDIMIGAPIFWMHQLDYVWAALAGALAAFWVGSVFRSFFRVLLYLDGFGAALFAVTAVDKTLMSGLGAPVAVIMGLFTGIGGGLLRDVLAGRPTLLMSRDIYATPILLGCGTFVAVRAAWAPGDYGAAAALTGASVIFLLRAAAIHWHLEMPVWLTSRDAPTE